MEAVLKFPEKLQSHTPPRHSNRFKTRGNVKSMDTIKYFNTMQIKLIRKTVKDKAILDGKKNQVTGLREWLVIDILTLTGVRVSEAADIRCGDIKTGYAQCELFIRDGKGSKSRTIQIPKSLKSHFNSFIKWKKDRCEPVGYDDHVFIGQRGPWTSQAVQQIVKKYLKFLNLYEHNKSVHALRHSYAVQLYKQEKDLRAVQKQLGHASIQTTQIYADVSKEDIQKQLSNFW
ncbi:tyrosine-type recombinase/integrase [Desulfobacula sp.]|uniref:tyrosine-type recombinase/integrase n=1 Tax=Desulfobacula sp. TaxID=2593537 RepID=UPI00263305CB|nr:tyrosine-type recombinase/integrase [Desulfobacula sp.]